MRTLGRILILDRGYRFTSDAVRVSKMKKHRATKYCHLCGGRLWRGGWVYTLDAIPDEQSIVVCHHCQETAPRCDVCGVPMATSHTRLPDGRRTCIQCHQTAVYDAALAQALFERVAGVVTDQLGLGLNVGAKFTLVDSQHLHRLAADVTPAPQAPGENRIDESTAKSPHQGPDNRIVGLFVRKGHRRVMYVVSGLPRILLIQTIAHEWAHAWQGENCPLLQNNIVREGFAEWAAYKTLETIGATNTLALMERQNSIYGKGLRQMLALEQRDGISGVLAFCRQAE